MDKRTFYFIFYVLLLTMTTPALCLKQQLEKELLTEEEQESVKLARQRRQAVLPIAAYAGLAVSPYVFAALVAAYGIYLVRRYNIRKASGWSIPCANNRGWCRPTCRFYEYIMSTIVPSAEETIAAGQGFVKTIVMNSTKTI